MRKEKSIFSLLAVLGFLLTGLATPLSSMVKQSNSGICHDADSNWYGQTKNFTAYGSMEECLESGRAYKGYSGAARTVARPRAEATTPYDRRLYDHWIDEDGDCQNARHELLQELSTDPVTLGSDGCTVSRGRWNGPYTGIIFTKARDMDIDHVVPLAWAHAHGGDHWDAELRRQFANDPVNLFAVQASANRSKGASGPLEWLPPDAGFHCQYVTRFHRIVLTYKLTYSDHERRKMDALRTRLCS